MSAMEDSSAHKVQAGTREGFYLSEDGEWVPDGWEDLTLGDTLADNSGSIKTGPFGTLLRADEYVKSGEGVPLISVREIRPGRIELGEHTPYVCEKTLERLHQYVLEPGDIVFGRKGGVERNALISDREKGWFLGSDGIRLRQKINDSTFLSYSFRSPMFKTWILQNAGGSTMPSLNQKIIERVPLKLPPLPEQKAIAAVLGSLDDKIELLREQNETLEALAQTLFKRWFIDFNFPCLLGYAKRTQADHPWVRTQADHPWVRTQCRHPELAIYGYKDFGGMPQPEEGSTAPNGQAGKCFIYVLRLENGNRYVGMTDFLLRRYHEHKTGKGAKATKASQPIAMIHFEILDSREAAAEREQWLKTGFGRKWLDREEEKGNLGAHVMQGPMIASELGEIPEGWRVGKLEEAVNIKYGKDHKALEDGEHPCYGSGGIMRYVARTLCDKESVLIPRKGTLSNLMYVRDPFWSVDTMFFTEFKKDDFVKYFFLLMDRVNLEEMNVGSAVPSMTTAVLNEMRLLYPDEQILKEFEYLGESLYSKVESNAKQIQTLTQLRDTLLPKLMKGEIRIPVES
ncbi:MAG: restriction endonuclease subunit S [Verrucomicrobiales bacterium]|nr:restriction endonuclease subunit S [Verrucomicrobiales bacterium]